MREVALALMLALAAAPAAAQDHAGHESMDHSGMDHGAMPQMDPATPAVPAAPSDHADHMDHTGHAAMEHSMPADEETPPPRALSGPRHAADAVWGAEKMAPAREMVRRSSGELTVGTFMLDRLEARISKGDDGYLWDAQGWYGGDIDKLWLKSEGEGVFSGLLEKAEVQALWSHAIGPFFDLQAGARHDFEPRGRTHAVIGMQGLAPYMFEVDAAAFLSDKGDVTARIEAEYDQRITQRLILQPRVETQLSAQDVPELGLGSGFSSVEAGLRLRYEIAREFAPYVGVGYEAKLGRTADFARAEGEDPDGFAVLLGLRAWF